MVGCSAMGSAERILRCGTTFRCRGPLFAGDRPDVTGRAGEGMGGAQMALWDGITEMTWLRGGPRDFRLAWPGLAWDNPGIRAGGCGPALVAASLWRAGGEPGRWA